MTRTLRPHLIWLPMMLLTALSLARALSWTLEAALLPEIEPWEAAPRRTPCSPATRLDSGLLSRSLAVSLEPSIAAPGDLHPAGATLAGTLIASDARWSLAAVLEGTERRSRTVMVGDSLLGGQVLAIERDQLVLARGDEQLIVRSGTEAIPPSINPPAQRASFPSLVALAPDSFEIRRSEILGALESPYRFATDARVIPSPNGLRIISIRPGSPLNQIGVQNGDVVRRVNGLDMTSAQNALEVLSRIRDWSRIDVELERSGGVVKKSFRML